MDGTIKRLRIESDYTVSQVAEYLGISEEEYLQIEQETAELSLSSLEKLADLYHQEEYDILTGEAKSKTVTKSPQQEKELIPFFRIVGNYLKMGRLLKEAKNE